MKTKKYILITFIILLILLNITCIYATENNTSKLNVDNGNNIENTSCEYCEDAVLQTNEINLSNQEILTQNNNEDILSSFTTVNTQVTLTVNDTSNFEETGNITINMHFSFKSLEHDGEFTSQNIYIYENNTLIKTLNIGEQNLPELPIIIKHDASHTIDYQADILFDYTVHDNSYLTTSLFGTYSNTLQFEKIKNTIITNLNNNSIIIDNVCNSNETWTNTIESLKKALQIVKNNGTINLNNINILQDTPEKITINKNITIIGNNASFTLQKTQTLIEINENSQSTFINLTFIGNNNYIISNKGKLKLINCTFKENSIGLINNIGKLDIVNCKIEDINRFYQTKTTNNDGLITNTGIVTIIKTQFNNNILLPYHLPSETNALKGIIYNKGSLKIDMVSFSNINYRIIYNNANMTLNNVLFNNIHSTSANPIYTLSKNLQLTQDYTYNNFKIQNNAKDVTGGVIYNNNNLNITNTTFQNINGNNGGAIYNNTNLNITNTTFQNINGNDGGAIYNNKELEILNTLFKKITGWDGGSIYNKNHLRIETVVFNNTQTRTRSFYGGGIYNSGECEIYNSTITEAKCTHYGGGIYNKGTLNVTDTLISNCQSGAGAGICNNGTMSLINMQIINNHQTEVLNEIIDHGGWSEAFTIGGGIIFNFENAKALITKSIIKDNSICKGTSNGVNHVYFGIIRNKGEMKITGSIFDNNQPTGQISTGGLNMYNSGKIIVMYSYLLNTQNYGNLAEFIYNTGTATLDYNFYCLNPGSIIQNANPNYYFIPAFEDEYYDIGLNESANITLTLGLTNGVDEMEFTDWDKLLTPGLNATITTINENGEYINIPILLKDKYTFNFNYTQNKGEYIIYGNILNYNNTVLVEIGKEFAEMTVTYNNITYNDGNNITFHIKVKGNLTEQPTGNITLTYNNNKITINLTNGECNYTINETLIPANYTMRIDYNGDEEYFKILKQKYSFTVHKIPTQVNITAPEVHYTQTGTITIKLTPCTARLYGKLYINGKAYKENELLAITDTQTFTINRVVGTYNLTIVLYEDEYYTGCSASTLFIVSKWNTNLTVESADIKKGENATLNITISPGDVRGDAILQINNETQNIFINNTMTPITLTDLEEGTYHVTVYYPGDRKYAASNASTTFSVSRITSKLNVQLTQNINLTGNIRIQTNPVNCTGEVAIYINNEKTILNLTSGTINTEIKFKRGTNYIYIHYNGDNTYSISSWNTTIKIEGNPLLTLETQDLRSDSTGYVRINLTDTNNIPYEYTDITIEFNNQTTTLKTDENGIIYYPVQLPAGKYSIKATYGNATIIKNITVKTTTRITVEIASINQDEDLMAYVTLTDYNNQKITGDVILEINGQYYKIIVTNGAGSRNLGEMKTDNYNYNATYIGEGLLASSQTTGTFNVAANNYRITGNKNINAYYGANKNYKIQLLNNNKPVKDAIITIKINKNTMQVKTDNQGYATLKLTLKPGKYTITSTYKNAKATNKITVKKTLITKNKKIKKGKTLTYTAKLLNKNGKKQKNKKITFKINGKKYKAKTNKKGIAKIKVKNLKKGKYKIKTSYGKQKNVNTITVK